MSGLVNLFDQLPYLKHWNNDSYFMRMATEFYAGVSGDTQGANIEPQQMVETVTWTDQLCLTMRPHGL